MDPPAFEDCTLALILGGRAVRLGGIVKSQLRLPDGRSILTRTLDLLAPHMTEIVFSGPTPVVGSYRTVPDVIADRGAAAGVHAACVSATTTWVLALAGDLPSVSLDVLRALWVHRGNAEVVVAGTPDARFEPLHAFYRAPMCAKVMGDELAAGERSFGQLYARLVTTIVPLDSLRMIDSTLSSFDNVNTWADVGRLGLRTDV